MGGSVVEPSIGDFGLIDQGILLSPKEEPKVVENLTMSDPSELQKLVLSSSVLITGDELKRHEEQIY